MTSGPRAPGQGHALVVEDDADSARMMAALVHSTGFTATTAGSLRDARRMLAMQQPDVVLLDLHLPDGNGMELLEVGLLPLRTEVVFVTGYASLESSILALRKGAADYLIKPVDRRRLQEVLGRFAPGSSLSAAAELRALRAAPPAALPAVQGCGAMVGASTAMQQVFDALRRVAPSSAPVFITGESGTGKELAARAVHDLSARQDRPFLAINCGALSPQLVESELFGHERGSFTGADRQHQGYFEQAHGGTLFLDEITEMPLDLQVKLLRVLEGGHYTRVGATASRQADVRVVAACNRDPARAVAEGRLREDLYWRLHVFPVHLPPLRERPGDIALIARHLLGQIEPRKTLSADAVAALAEHGWPGNVRELRNALQRACVLARGETIGRDLLLPRAAPAAPSAAADSAAVGAGTNAVAVPAGTALDEAERMLVLAACARHGQRREPAAAELGISLKTLYNRLKAYGLA